MSCIVTQRTSLLGRQRGNSITSSSSRAAFGPLSPPARGRAWKQQLIRASPDTPAPVIDVSKIAELIASQPLADEERQQLEQLAGILEVPLGTAKQMAFKRRGLLSMDPDELRRKLQQIIDVVDVPPAMARQMVSIQPGLLFDTERQAEALQMGIKVISYELNAPREEVVELILKNQSVLHGRQMHLSVADIAHLAMARQPTGRIVE